MNEGDSLVFSVRFSNMQRLDFWRGAPEASGLDGRAGCVAQPWSMVVDQGKVAVSKIKYVNKAHRHKIKYSE